MRKAYQTDLSDAEWSCLEPHLPAPKATGRPGCTPCARSSTPSSTSCGAAVPGDCLPHDFPPWKTVYHYFRSWRLDGTWERMHSALRKRVRVRLKRNPQPSAAIVDSQSVKTTGRRWGRARLRRGQEGQRTKAPSAGGHAGIGARSPGPQRKIQDREGIKLLLDTAARDRLPAPLSPVAGRRLHRRRQGRGLGAEGRWDGRPRSCATHRSWLRRR